MRSNGHLRASSQKSAPTICSGDLSFL